MTSLQSRESKSDREDEFTFTFSIIRASWHNVDKNISLFQDGGQSLSQALASLIMRRLRPCRDWNKKIVNDIVKLGETIQDESLKQHHRAAFKLSDIVQNVEYLSKEYTFVHKEFLMDVSLASPTRIFNPLETSLKNNQCFIINIPHIVAIWYEDNKFFMYDPNEGNLNGGNRCSKEKAEEFANATCFQSLRDLAVLYARNISDQPAVIVELCCNTVNVMDVIQTRNKKKGSNKNWRGKN